MGVVVNFADELIQCPDIIYSLVSPPFNATKLYNLLQTLTFSELVGRFTENLALFTELLLPLIYFSKKAYDLRFGLGRKRKSDKRFSYIEEIN